MSAVAFYVAPASVAFTGTSNARRSPTKKNWKRVIFILFGVSTSAMALMALILATQANVHLNENSKAWNKKWTQNHKSSEAKLSEMLASVSTLTKQLAKTKDELAKQTKLDADVRMVLLLLAMDLELNETSTSVRMLAGVNWNNTQYMKSILLYYTAGMVDKSTGFLGLLSKLQDIAKISLAVKEMVKGKKDLTMAKSLAIPLMKELLEALDGIHDVMHEYKVKYKALGLEDIARCYFYFRDVQRYTSLNIQIKDFMEDELGEENAKEYSVYGHSFESAGYGLELMGKHAEAVYFYERAIEAYMTATDSTEEGRDSALKRAKENLATIKGVLG